MGLDRGLIEDVKLSPALTTAKLAIVILHALSGEIVSECAGHPAGLPAQTYII